MPCDMLAHYIGLHAQLTIKCFLREQGEVILAVSFPWSLLDILEGSI